MLAVAAVSFGMHYRHLAADFPNFSPWMDWSKYTDEGWYGDAAIRLFQRGHWYVAGDFNPAVALPVLPLAEALVFRIVGVSLVSARAFSVSVFGLTLAAAWLLLARRRTTVPGTLADGTQPDANVTLAAAVAVLLLAASPFCYVFTRLAIIEPLLVLEMLCALLLAGHLQRGPGADAPAWVPRAAAVLLALLLPAMVLTKTTAVFLLPAIAWQVFAGAGYRFRRLLRTTLPIALGAAAVWLGYYLLLVRPHYLLDYRYLFSANAYTGITLDTFAEVIADTVKDGMWIGRLLYPCALAGVVVVLVVGLLAPRRLRDRPLAVTLVLWSAGYAAFLAYHDNLQPRYYLVIAVPLTLLVPLVLADLLLPALTRPTARRLATVSATLLLAGLALEQARQTLHYVRHPEYTFVAAASKVATVIREGERADPSHNPLVLSISGSDLSLITGLPSICDDFGTLELVDRVKLYRPGWYVAWNQVDDDKMDAMSPLYHLERVAAFPAFDDPDRNLLIVYRLDPPTPVAAHGRKRRLTPRRLVTRVGQQPSTEQLQH